MDDLLSRVLNFLPGAEASSKVDTATDSCSSARVLQKGVEQVNARRLNSKPSDQSEISTNQGNSLPTSGGGKDLKCSGLPTPEEIKKCLEGVLGHSIPDLEAHCVIEDEILQIRRAKTPDNAQQEKLKEAYEKIQLRVSELAPCNQKLIELLSEMSSDDSYSIDALHPLPELVASLLDKVRKGYTISDLNLLANKFNEISREMINKLQGKNDNEALCRWIDVMLDSAAKNNDFYIPSFQVALKVLRSKLGETLTWEQEEKLREMASLYKKNDISEQEKAVANEILRMTESEIALVRVVSSYLEPLPKDIERLSNQRQKIELSLFGDYVYVYQVLAPITIGFLSILVLYRCFMRQRQ